MTIPTAPSAAPTNVRMTGITSTSVTVRWGKVPCIEQNGDITSYRIRVMTRRENDRIKTVGDVREATVTGLSPSTEYTVSVAAVNNEGSGPYSDGIVQSTNGKLVHYNRVEVF